MTSDVFNMDCMEYMRTLPDKFFDLAIADPPYGLPARSTHGRGKLKTRILNADDIHRWDMAPGADFFDELFRVSRNQIIWGGNYFRLPPCRCFVCWDKKQPWENFSQCEYAWTSFDKPAKIFRFDNRRGKKIHPTQKPVDLYSWLLATFATGGDRIFDPMFGSGSSRIAAYKAGFDYWGCEKDKDYFDRSCVRFRTESAQLNLF